MINYMVYTRNLLKRIKEVKTVKEAELDTKRRLVALETTKFHKFNIEISKIFRKIAINRLKEEKYELKSKYRQKRN